MWCRRRVERGIKVKSRGDVKKLCATKTNDATERQLVHTLAQPIVFIYRFVISRTGVLSSAGARVAAFFEKGF